MMMHLCSLTWHLALWFATHGSPLMIDYWPQLGSHSLCLQQYLEHFYVLLLPPSTCGLKTMNDLSSGRRSLSDSPPSGAHTAAAPASQRKAEKRVREAPSFSSAATFSWAGKTTVAARMRRRPPTLFVVLTAAAAVATTTTTSASLHIIHPRATRGGLQRNQGW